MRRMHCYKHLERYDICGKVTFGPNRRNQILRKDEKMVRHFSDVLRTETELIS